MKRSELEKSKGISERKTVQSASEALLTTKVESGEEMKAEPKKAVKKPKSEVTKQKKEAKEKVTASKAGRPKGEPSTKISLNMPNKYLDMINIAAGFAYKGNTSSYIISLVEKDIEENGKAYKQIQKIMK